MKKELSIKLNLRLGTLKINGGGQLTFVSCGTRQTRDNDYMSVTTCNTRVKINKKTVIRDFDQQTASTGRSLSLKQTDIFSVMTPQS